MSVKEVRQRNQLTGKPVWETGKFQILIYGFVVAMPA